MAITLTQPRLRSASSWFAGSRQLQASLRLARCLHATTIPLRFILVRGQSPTASQLAIGSLPSRNHDSAPLHLGSWAVANCKPACDWLVAFTQKTASTGETVKIDRYYLYLPDAIELIKQHRSNINDVF